MRSVLLVLAIVATPAFAEEQVYRLSEADKQAALEAASRQAEPPLPLPIIDGRAPDSRYASPDNRPNGEVGMMVGTGGTRALWGTTSIPLGENSSASLGFSTGRFPTFDSRFNGGLRGNQYDPRGRRR